MAKKIRVLECIRQGQIGGGESHLLSLVQNLDKAKFEPIVLSFTEGPMVEKLREMGIDCHVIYTTKPFDISKWKAVKKFIKEKKPDIIHAHGTRANSNVLRPAKSLKIPVIYTVHGWSFHQDQKPWVKKMRIMGESYLTSNSDLNISVSASNQQSGKEVIRSFNSVVINNGIDPLHFNADTISKDIRKELGIANDDIVVLFIARFTSHKQPLPLIHAFAKALKKEPRLKLLMVGDGDDKEKAKQIVSDYKLEERIVLQPFRSDVKDILAAGDIFVLPSLWEGLPIGLLEAMAMGKAIVATNVDGTKEVIQNNINGLLIETSSLIDNLADAIVKLSKDAELRNSFGSKAKERINETYNAVNMTREIESIYSDFFYRTNKPTHGI